MKYASIEGVKKPVSRIISGTALYENWMREEPLFEVLDAALENGINAIDTGREYADGAAERAIGNWLSSRKCRDEMVLISKGGHHDNIRKRVTPYDVTADIMDSLCLLNTDHIDLYMLHRDDETQEVGPIVEALHAHYEAGRICTYGASNWSRERVEKANAYAKQHGLRPFKIISDHFSLGVMIGDPFGGGCISLTGEDMAEDRKWFTANKIPLLCYSSLCMGVFSGIVNRDNYKKLYEEGRIVEPAFRVYCHDQNFDRIDRTIALAKQKGVSAAEITLAYVLQYGDEYGPQTFALVAGANAAEVNDSAKAADLSLTRQEMDWLYAGK